jgi:hypothetical protein
MGEIIKGVKKSKLEKYKWDSASEENELVPPTSY